MTRSVVLAARKSEFLVARDELCGAKRAYLLALIPADLPIGSKVLAGETRERVYLRYWVLDVDCEAQHLFAVVSGVPPALVTASDPTEGSPVGRHNRLNDWLTRTWVKGWGE